MNALESISPSHVGECLRQARENANLRQQEAAELIDVARTTLVAIEKGERRIRMNELQQLAKLYNVSVNALFREEAVHIDFATRFRKESNAIDEDKADAIKTLSQLVKAEIELENLLGIRRTKNYPPERPILKGDVRVQAEHDALDLRQQLGLGNAPISDIVTLLEMEMGVRVYIRKINPRISGLFAYDKEVGACILLNASHRKTRRTQSAAHECGHFISTRNEPEVLLRANSDANNSREERYANAFGRAFLTPPRAVMQKFGDITAGSDKLTRRHIILLSHFFGVSREAMVRRLEELGLAKRGTWDWFKENGDITDKHVRQVLGDRIAADVEKAEAYRPTTVRLGALASEAYRKELLTEGQLSELLDLNRVELREILDDIEMDHSEADDNS